MRKCFTGIALVLAVAVFALTGCSGTTYTVRAGFIHNHEGTDKEGDMAGWDAGGTIALVAQDGLEAVELCGVSGFSFGKIETKTNPKRTDRDYSTMPVEVCAELPFGRQ